MANAISIERLSLTNVSSVYQKASVRSNRKEGGQVPGQLYIFLVKSPVKLSVK
jgi:hypothetical protein